MIRFFFLELTSCKQNIPAVLLEDAKIVLLPIIHIKLGLMKNFVKALHIRMGKHPSALLMKFPAISETKLKAGIFVGPYIQELFRDSEFLNCLTQAHIEGGGGGAFGACAPPPPL